MSLTPCRECGRELSTEALSCPHCGAPSPGAAPRRPWRGSWGFEWRSQREIAGWPVVHVAVGRNPEGRLRVAKGIIAVGQFGVGLITVAQFGVGVLFGAGQFILGGTALAQVAVSVLVAVGQVAVGYVAVGQVAAGVYALAQVGWARHLWDATHRDPAAVAFFTALWEALKARLW
ncbi:MAG: zinc ribbon domain-containing protein [Syntrophobacterales bacterium]|nr:zinc ribbon domain-containing protein [Syntrophobacterales bacterium]